VHLVEHVGDEVIPHRRDRHDLKCLDPYTKHTYSPSLTRETKDKNRAHQNQKTGDMSRDGCTPRTNTAAFMPPCF
jgi:hypothetical protein